MAISNKNKNALEAELEMQQFALDNSVSLGVDIVDIARMKKVLQRTPSFARRVFSQPEREYCDKSSTPESHYAARFAAKEAVLKALGTGFSGGIRPKDIEVKLNSKGRPRVVLRGKAAQFARENDVCDIPISLSHTHTEAVAIAMAITADVVKAEEKRIDPAAELARQFKEARLMLDDIDKSSNSAGEQTSIDFGE